MKESKKPGVMIYFDIKNCIKRLDLEGIGRLFLAILEYAENGKIPDFSEEDTSLLCVAWDIMQPKIDADNERYIDMCKKKQEAAYKRWGKDE